MKLFWRLLVWIVVLLVLGETAVLLRIDLSANTESIRASFSRKASVGTSCEEWLEKNDRLPHLRDFETNPVRVEFSETQGTENCPIKCIFSSSSPGSKVDAIFGFHAREGIAKVARSMESSLYYSEFELNTARSRGYSVVMTTSLLSDVPVGYFSWAEYDLMAPVEAKTEKSLAAAFISNCGGHNFRLEAVSRLQSHGVTVDSYGNCLRNVHRSVDKVQALKHYKFSLAFENSNEEDYVTEKFWQSLVAGSVPVVIGASNILDFAPAPGSVIPLKSVEDVPDVARTMKYLASNETAYNETLRWKFEGPSDSFKALIDMAAVHSSCRLCIHLATNIRRQELQHQNASSSSARPCKCTRGSTTTYHIYVRERGRFYSDSFFLRSDDLTVASLELAITAKFSAKQHVPIWNEARPQMLKWNGSLRIHKIYPVHLTQRQALYSWNFTDDLLRNHIEANPCAELEVIFV